MKVPFLLATLSLVVGTTWLLAQKPTTSDTPKPIALFPEGYLDHDGLTTELKRIAAEQPKSVKVDSLTKTLQGKDIWVASLGVDPKVKKPAILLVANLEADHVVGSHVALKMIEKLAKSDVGLLEKVALFVIPRLGTDGTDHFLKTKPSLDFRLNLRPIDRDRDGRSNEDGPDDLDGDGVLTRMRAKDSKATLVADSADPRILRKADATKNELPVYSEYAEGIDNDGDGLINEDPVGGVNLNRNYPHKWSEYDPEAGAFPGSEPATLAILKFTSEHPEIVAVWTFSISDSLAVEPKKPGSTLDDADLPFFVELSKAYIKATTKPAADTKAEAKKDENAAKAEEKPTEKPAAATEAQPKEAAKTKGQGRGGRGGQGGGAMPSTASAAKPTTGGDLSGTTDGSLAEWAYHQFGVFGFSSRLWSAPEIPEPAEGAPKPPAEGEARWLFWNDTIAGGKAFVPLKTVDHPTLGKVEIGGWRPGVRLNPSADTFETIADQQLAYLRDFTGRLPKLEVKDLVVTPKGAGLFEIKASVTNTGQFPTTLAQGVRVRRPGPLLVKLEIGKATILSGRKLTRIDALAGNGGKQEFRWLLMAPETKSVDLIISHPKVGTINQSIELK